MGNPFVIEEADISFTLGSNSSISVWMGGCAQRLTLGTELVETPIQYHGQANEEIQHTNQIETIEIENVWLLDTTLVPPLAPLIKRGQILNMVIVWQDETTGYFNKRTYYGVTGRVQRVGDQAMQNLSFKAQRMIEESGTTVLDIQPTAVNQVFYVDGTNSVPLYNYNPVTGAYTPVDTALIPSLAEIKALSGGRVDITIGGTLALRATAAKTSVKALVAAGTTVGSGVPRLEFKLGSRVASLSQDGTLVVGNVAEEDPVATSSEFQLAYAGGGTAGFASIGAFGLVAPTVGEDLP